MLMNGGILVVRRYVYMLCGTEKCTVHISPELYCRAVLAAEVFELYAKLISKEDIAPVLFIREYKKIKGGF